MFMSIVFTEVVCCYYAVAPSHVLQSLRRAWTPEQSKIRQNSFQTGSYHGRVGVAGQHSIYSTCALTLRDGVAPREKRPR